MREGVVEVSAVVQVLIVAIGLQTIHNNGLIAIVLPMFPSFAPSFQSGIHWSAKARVGRVRPDGLGVPTHYFLSDRTARLRCRRREREREQRGVRPRRFRPRPSRQKACTGQPITDCLPSPAWWRGRASNRPVVRLHLDEPISRYFAHSRAKEDCR